MLVIEFRDGAGRPGLEPVIAGPFDDGSITISTNSIYRRRKDGQEGAFIADKIDARWRYKGATYSIADVREFDPRRHQLDAQAQ